MKNIKRKRIRQCKRSPLFLFIFIIFSILYFASSASAQRPQNRMLSPEEASALGYDTGNPPGPYWKTERGVFELNGKDSPQPPNGPGYAGVGCDSRQDPAIYSSPNADPSKFKSWESGSCMENGKPCCVNIDRAGYPIPIGDPRYVIQDFQREQCKNLDQLPPFIRNDLKEICDFIEQEKNGTLPLGSPIAGTGDSPVKVALEEARAAKQAAEQALANAKTKLEEVIATEQGAQDQLTTAQTLLDQATTAEQAAQQAADQEAAEYEEALRAAQAEVDKAQQEVDAAMNALNEAQAELDAINQQIADAQNRVNEATATKESAEQELQTALAKVAELRGNNPTNPGDGGNNSTIVEDDYDPRTDNRPYEELNPLQLAKKTQYIRDSTRFQELRDTPFNVLYGGHLDTLNKDCFNALPPNVNLTSEIVSILVTDKSCYRIIATINHLVDLGVISDPASVDLPRMTIAPHVPSKEHSGLNDIIGRIFLGELGPGPIQQLKSLR